MLNLQVRDHQSYSSICSTFLTCTQKYYNRYVEKVPVIWSADAMSVGKAVDLALAYAGKVAAFDDVMKENRIVFDNDKWYAYSLGVFAGRDKLYKRIFGDAVVNLQESFSFPIVDKETGEIIQNITGMLDGHEANGGAIFEVKTVSKTDDGTINGYILNGQTEMYCHAMQIGGEIPLVKYRFVQKPMIRQKKDETESDFLDRMIEAGKVAAENVVDRDIQYSLETVQEVIDNITDIIKNNLDAKPVKNRSNCIQYGSPCEYYQHCWKHPAVNLNNESEVA